MISKTMLGLYVAMALAGSQSTSYLTEIASMIGVDVKTLASSLTSGKSIAELAASKGISETTLISSLQSQLKDRLDQAVSNGRLSREKESQMLSGSVERFQKLVEHKGLFRGE